MCLEVAVSMNPVDLAFTPALEQARLVRAKEISPLELVQLYLDRIQQIDFQLGSYFTVIAEAAITDAKAKTEQLTHAVDTSELPPFLGCRFQSKTFVLLLVSAVPWAHVH